MVKYRIDNISCAVNIRIADNLYGNIIPVSSFNDDRCDILKYIETQSCLKQNQMRSIFIHFNYAEVIDIAVTV